MDYIERLSLVNKDADQRSVWTSIDRPMRPLIYQIYRIGLMTQFCCCGFPYELDEGEEPKSHHRRFTYMFVFDPSAMREPHKKSQENFDRLWKMATDMGWIVSRFNAGRVHFYYENPYPDLYMNSESELQIHDYESQVLAIYKLTSMLRDNIDTAVEDNDIQIIDGNYYYHAQGITEWQVKPKQPGVMSADIIDELERVEDNLKTTCFK